MDLRACHDLSNLARIASRMALCLATLGSGAAAANAQCADLALVLAIDGSGSIDAEEFSLQQAGYASAFLSSRVQAALASAGRVSVAVVLWGDDAMARDVLPWQTLDNRADAEALSARIARMPRHVSGNTGIGSGIAQALDLLSMPDICSPRKVINVSGDGKESHDPHERRGVPLAAAKARATDMGVTINALAITNEVADLSAWYSDRVITGPGAFVMDVAGFGTFGTSIERKLAREIGLPQVADLSAIAGPGPLPEANRGGSVPGLGAWPSRMQIKEGT
jgi:Protein of unknown function (DUF1194)